MIGILGRTALVSLAIAIGVCAGERSAFAQASASTSVAAQALFDEAKRLMQAGDAASACPKFEESQRLEPGVGTKLNLANCYERVGRTASAWILYLEVESDTKRNGQVERQTLAHDRAAALAPKLSRITIDVPAASRADGLAIERDGISVGSAQWGLSIPVDPGPHTIVARAPGKKDWQKTISVAADASTQTLGIPVLEAAPFASKSSPSATPNSVPAKPRSHTQRYASYVAFGVGGAGVIVGSVFGLSAISKNNQSNSSDCQGNTCLRGSTGAQARSDARSAGNISTVAFAVGIAGLGTGLVLFLTEPKQEAAAASASASLSAFALPGGGAFSLRGAF
jgi:hypothetical protein